MGVEKLSISSLSETLSLSLSLFLSLFVFGQQLLLVLSVCSLFIGLLACSFP